VESIGLDTLESETNIIPVVVGDNEKTIRVGESLKERGVMIPVIRKPTVTTPRLRVSLSANHTREDIDRFIEILKEVI